MKKYKSEIDEALHGDILGLFEIGAISEAELREFEADCFIDEDDDVANAAGERGNPEGNAIATSWRTVTKIPANL